MSQRLAVAQHVTSGFRPATTFTEEMYAARAIGNREGGRQRSNINRAHADIDRDLGCGRDRQIVMVRCSRGRAEGTWMYVVVRLDDVYNVSDAWP